MKYKKNQKKKKNLKASGFNNKSVTEKVRNRENMLGQIIKSQGGLKVYFIINNVYYILLYSLSLYCRITGFVMLLLSRVPLSHRNHLAPRAFTREDLTLRCTYDTQLSVDACGGGG